MGIEIVHNTMGLTGNQRIACLDYARIFVAFLVIYGHLYEYDPNNIVRVFIYQFHMPIFFVISGMLHKYNGKIQWKKYIKTLLIPVCFFQILFFVYENIMIQLGIFSNPMDSISGNFFVTCWHYVMYGLPKIVKGTFLYCGPCWFLIGLFYCKVFYDFAVKHIKLASVIWLILFVTLCYYKHKYLFISNFVMAMPYYVLGTYAKMCITFLETTRYKMLYAITGFLIVVLCIFVNGSVSSWAISFGHNSYKPLSIIFFYLTGCAGSLMVLSICSYFHETNIISNFLGTTLISIVGFQSLYTSLLKETCGINKGYLISIFIALAIFLACVLSHVITMKVAPFLLGKSKTK